MISLENRKYKQGGQNKGSDEMWTYDAQGRIKSVKWGKYITWKENVRLYLSNDAVKTVAYQNQNQNNTPSIRKKVSLDFQFAKLSSVLVQ